jgi:hypothetical protein
METNSKPSGNLGNQNAAKENPLNSTLHIRCRGAEKACWVRAARGKPLPIWVRDTLNRSATG